MDRQNEMLGLLRNVGLKLDAKSKDATGTLNLDKCNS